MPCLEVSLPRTELAVREKLMTALTDIGVDVAGFGRDVFRIRFCEYDVGEAGMAGKLWDGNHNPYLHFLLYCPRLKQSVKQRLITEMSRAFVEIVEQPEWFPVFHICEHPYDNIGASGKPLVEKYPELAGRQFYFDLPKD
jgi:phenylpyruvate tautomerase PptA (4-oxalocrotonate tautomerase family)